MLSNALLSRDPELAERIWNEVQRQRESETYLARVRDYLARPGH
jgi:polar amino acid transport system substrate-binding protein